jgi:hypothetical protein
MIMTKTLLLAALVAFSGIALSSVAAQAASPDACAAIKAMADRQDSGADRDGFRQYVMCLANGG